MEPIFRTPHLEIEDRSPELSEVHLPSLDEIHDNLFPILSHFRR